MKRKSLLFILTALIGIVLFSSLVFDKLSLSDVKKAGFLFIKVPEKISRDHQQQEIMLTDKTVIKQLLPAHPVSKNINELEETIFTILDDNRLNGAITGISVHRVDDGSPLFSYNANTRLLPASNMKIITTIAVLETLGPDYQFTTEIKTDGKLKSGILKGNLYIVGKGDPTLQKKDFDDLAKQLRKQGIEKITGAIIADDSWYDDVRYSQDLNWTDENNYTGSAVSALTASPNDDHLSGSIIVDVFPGKKVGDKPKVRITPETGYITIVNRAKTVAQSEGFSLTTERYLFVICYL